MKSHVSVFLDLARCIIADAHARCATESQVERDFITLKSRTENEGLSFLTITLPTFGEDFDKSLNFGRISDHSFRAFKRAPRKLIPAFLQGITSHIFCPETGVIHDNPSIDLIKAVREIAYVFKKVRIPCTDNRVRKAYTRFIEDEQDLKIPIASADLEYFKSVSLMLWSDMFNSDLLLLDNVIPKHGPGATCEGIRGNLKYHMRSWNTRLEPYFPMFPMVFSSTEAIGSSEYKECKEVSEEQESPVRVITVPKTLKTPRIIAIEPVCMQYTQQGLSDMLRAYLGRNEYSAGHINFRDQSVNQRLALMSSKTNLLATIDLTSASDRVRADVVSTMLCNNHDFHDAVFACRSTHAKLPEVDESLPLRKFASMGSALCFPIESMYFFTICTLALLEAYHLPLTFSSLKRATRDLYVYGDDIVVPVNAVATVIGYLTKFQCKVNATKSYVNGSFRESCGVDAFKGVNVSPVYIREVLPRDRRDADGLVSWVATANQAAQSGYDRFSTMMFQIVENILGRMPEVLDTSPALGRIVEKLPTCQRWDTKLHRALVKAWVVRPVYERSELDGYAALQKCLLSLSRRTNSVTSTDAQHLLRHVRRGAVALQRRWVPNK